MSRSRPVTYASIYADVEKALVTLDTCLDHLWELRESKVVTDGLDEVVTKLRRLYEEEMA
jgi:hypothetical protein